MTPTKEKKMVKTNFKTMGDIVAASPIVLNTPSEKLINEQFENHKRSRASEAPSFGMALDLFKEGIKFGMAYAKGDVSEPVAVEEDKDGSEK